MATFYMAAQQGFKWNLIIIQVSDPFLCTFPSGIQSNYIKFTKHILRSSIIKLTQISVPFLCIIPSGVEPDYITFTRFGRKSSTIKPAQCSYPFVYIIPISV
jgi:hypothetical protein